ncbi:MAG: aminotransferase class I/II-fold pyridoxal phosphate-dependent enzyme [Armatimonadia bacterium]|nr:aminotransferase class I/II-fold pyridoxal phosphate-dependent enzyme [Armatimonadia bacterium]
MAKLAINGGTKVIDRRLGKEWPIFDDTERESLMEVLESGRWWRGGGDAETSKVTQFEERFAELQDAKHGVAITNGTQAIECALKAVDIQPGDEVICPAATFVATATACILVNAIPIVVDIDPDNYQISPEAVETAITDRTVGILPVHYGGYPADMASLQEIADRHGLWIIEDSAHAHGSKWNGRGCGSIGDIGTFSLQMGKTLTAGEGGICLTNDDELAEKLYSYHHIGRFPGRPFYEHHIVASNLRLTEWQAAVLLGGVERLEEQAETRDANAKHLEAGLREIEGVSPLERDDWVTRWNFYFYHFKFNSEEFGGISKQKFQEALSAEGLSTGTGHLAPIQKNPLFTERNWGPACFGDNEAPDYASMQTPECDRIYEEEGCVLTHRLFLGGTEDMDLMLEAIQKVRDNMDELR